MSDSPLSPNIHIQILLTDRDTFSYNISWENMLKDQSNISLVIMLLILETFSVDYVFIFVREKFDFGHSWDLKG